MVERSKVGGGSQVKTHADDRKTEKNVSGQGDLKLP